MGLKINLFGLTISIFSRKKLALHEKVQGIDAELDDHLLAINENTSEIQSQHEHLCDVENKLDKMMQKIEALELEKQALARSRTLQQQSSFSSSLLTPQEQQVFLALYTAQALTFDELCGMLAMPSLAVRSHIATMARKGVPVHVEQQSGVALVSLPEDFKQLQARENVLNFPAVNEQAVA